MFPNKIEYREDGAVMHIRVDDREEVRRCELHSRGFYQRYVPELLEGELLLETIDGLISITTINR